MFTKRKSMKAKIVINFHRFFWNLKFAYHSQYLSKFLKLNFIHLCYIRNALFIHLNKFLLIKIYRNKLIKNVYITHHYKHKYIQVGLVFCK